MRAMKDSGVAWLGMIPVSWDIKPIGSGFTEVKNKNINNFPLDPLQFRYGKIVKKEKVWSGEEAEDTYSAYNIVSPDMIMINGLNLEFDFITQRVALVTEEGIITSTYLALKTSSNVYPSYANYLLKAYDACKVFHSLGRGLRKTLTFSELKKQPMLFLDYEEQKRIVAFLDAKCAQIDAIIEKQQQVIEKLKAYKQSVITEVVTKGLDPSVPMKDSGVEWIGMVPEGWSIPKINYCFTSIGSGTTPSSDDESFYNGPIYWIQSGDINGGVLTTTQKTITEQAYANYSALRIHKQPFIVVAMYGASIGNPSLSTIDACTNQACCVLGGSQNNIDFMFYVMVAAKAALVYSGKGGTQPNISQDIIKKLRIPQPTPLEQVHIAEYLREKCYVIEKTLEKKLSVIDKLTDYKKSLIYEAVTGKMEV